MRFLLQFLLYFLVLPVCASHATEPSVERILLEQPLQLAKQTYPVKVWIDSRQVFQQQALIIHVQLTAQNSGELPSLAVASQADSVWLKPMVSSEPSLTKLEQTTQAHWQVLLFAKQIGINPLPNLRLHWQGESMSRQTQTLPSWTINVLPLPMYVPHQAILGEIVDMQTHLNLPSIALVDEVIQRQIQFSFVNHQPNSVWLTDVHGQNIDPLSSWLEAGATQWQDEGLQSIWTLWQPWRISQAGFWQVEAQDVWVFNPKTWQVTHLQLPAHSGWAIPLWLWQLALGLGFLMGLGLLVLAMRYLQCRLKRQHYQQAIYRAADSAQLYQAILTHWSLKVQVPLAHQATNLPIYQTLVQLENHLYSKDCLYSQDFIDIKQSLIARAHHLPCNATS